MSNIGEERPQLNRRQFMQMTSLLALGLAYQKPTIETLHPNTSLGQYGQSDESGPTGQYGQGKDWDPGEQGGYGDQDAQGDQSRQGGQGSLGDQASLGERRKQGGRGTKKGQHGGGR